MGEQFSLPADHRGTARLGWRLGTRAVRILISVQLLAVAAWMLVWQSNFRIIEAVLASRWIGTAVHGHVDRYQNAIYFTWLDGPLIGLRISPECSVALLIGPLIVIGAILMAVSRFGIGRLLLGLVLASSVLMMVNQVRFAVIAMSMQKWGLPGYTFSHQFVATLLGLAGFTAAAILMVWVATGTRILRSRRGNGGGGERS